MDRCDLMPGDVQDLPVGENFDAVLSVLVAHFVKREERLGFYQNMQQRLRTGCYLVNSEVSFDFNSLEFPSMLKNWERIQTLAGATTDSLKSLPNLLRDTLAVLPPSETESLIRASGMSFPVRFFQALMITCW